MSARLERIPNASLRNQVVRAIRDAIIQGKFKPGEKVPEQELAAELGVSRTPIREAIRVLEQQGLVETRPKNGTFIAKVDWNEARDGLAVRATLEELAVREAIERMDPGEWDQFCGDLERLLDRMDLSVEAGDLVGATEADTEWHTTLIDAAENRYLSHAWRSIGLPFLIWSPERDVYPLARDRAQIVFTSRHRELLTALRTRDPDVSAQGIRDHIAKKLRDLEERGPANASVEPDAAAGAKRAHAKLTTSRSTQSPPSSGERMVPK